MSTGFGGSDEGAMAIVPARAGSKGIPGKNLGEVGGMSLVARAISVARAVPDITRVVVSTDGERIAEEAQRHGADVHWRPADLAGDDAHVIDAVRHLRQVLADEGRLPLIGVLLEPTTPLRSPDDVAACLREVRAGADSAATFSEASLHPQRAFVLDDGEIRPYLDGAVAWRPRQQLRPSAYQLTGGAYAFDFRRLPAEGRAFLFGRMAAVVTPRQRSIDIDDDVDLLVVQALLARRSGP